MKIFTAKKIFVDGKFEEKLAVVVSGEKIEDIISHHEVEHFKNFAEFYDFGENLLLPGFIDTHTHMMGYGLNTTNNLNSTMSWEEAEEVIKKTLTSFESDVYIFTDFDESKWRKNKLPTRKDIDKISSKKAIFLRRICGHIGVGNTAFINLISGNPAFDSAKLSENEGIFIEDVPLHIYDIFPPSEEVMEKAFEVSQRKFLEEGITTISEIGNKRAFRFLQRKWKKGELKLRIRYYLSDVDPDYIISSGFETGLGDHNFKFMGIKFFADGSVGGESAYFSFPYGDNKSQGVFLLPDNFFEIAEKCVSNQIQLAIHAIGDFAIRKVIEILEALTNPGLVRIEHFEFPDKDDIKKISKLKIKLSIQPNFIENWGMEGGMYHKKLGDFYKSNNPLKTLISAGVNFAFGSDAMPPSPLAGIIASTKHPLEEERLTIEEAIPFYTEWGGHLTFEQNIIGKIKPGYLADFVVVDKNFKKVIATFVGGDEVYDGRGDS
ncbi:MAG: amidohydrolase family protein [candidate division WOR-3 bacterium]